MCSLIGQNDVFEYPFGGCIGLTSVTIPNSVKKIGEGAFDSCTDLTSVTIPNSVEEIGDYAFAGCTGLISLTIPNSVEEIGDYAFYVCTGLISLTISNSVKKIGDDAFGGCAGLISLTIPNSVKKIGEGAFAYCTGLTSVTIPNSVKQIGDYAFSSCTGLTSVTIQNPNLQLHETVFESCPNLKPSSVVYQKANNSQPPIKNQDNTSAPSGKKPLSTEKKGTITQESNSFEGQEIYTIVGEMPSFPGGDQLLQEYLANNINYPQQARENGIEGRVFVNFIVEPNGSLSNIQITKSLGGGCDEEALRVVNTMPKWNPGKQNGKPVRVSYIMPIKFND